MISRFDAVNATRRLIDPVAVKSSAARTRRSQEIERPLQLIRNADVAVAPIVEVLPTNGDLMTRGINVALATIALVLLSPLLLLVALAVRLTSPGPILHVQVRVGLDRRGPRPPAGADSNRRIRDLGGRAFAIYKFRSMYADAEKRSGAVWATKNDPRITPIGRFLRKSRLDEIPQLINVIKGDMNIVGPRPERPTLFAELRESIEGYPLRQLAKPGITGWAQINQAYDSCLEDVRNKVRFDLEYIRRRSVRHDLSIMLRTLPVMLFRKGGQ
jgi:lipopolysaccharide/colanic/teichoic acid biosynthesis glycosyltransferase